MNVETYVSASISHRTNLSCWAYTVIADKKILSECTSGSFAYTHRRAELEAVVESIKEALSLGASSITIHGASEFVTTAYRRWAKKWNIGGWQNSSGVEIPDADLWAIIQRHRENITFSKKNGVATKRASNYAESIAMQQDMSGIKSPKNKRTITTTMERRSAS